MTIFCSSSTALTSAEAVLFRYNRFRLHLVMIVRIFDFCAYRWRFFRRVYFGGTPAAAFAFAITVCMCHLEVTVCDTVIDRDDLIIDPNRSI